MAQPVTGHLGAHRRGYDVIVVGLGIMGAAALDQLSARGLRVLGLEAGGPLHTLGSSHGDSRIFRRAYWEGERYLPLLDRSLESWRELDDAFSGRVLRTTGGLFIGRRDSALVRGSRATADRCGIRYEDLTPDEVMSRFPAFRPNDDSVAVYEPDAMMLFADQARLAYLSRSVERGAQVGYGQPVRELVTGGGSATVVGDGWRVDCSAVVLTAGSWIGRFLPGELGPLIRPMRIPVWELDVAAADQPDHQPDRLPVFLHEDASGSLVYGLPQWRAVDGGVRVGFHNRQLSPVDPGRARPAPTDDERLELWRAVSAFLPRIRCSGRGTACVYTMSADESFLLGRSAEHPGVVYASACSGHGFKFAPAIGEALAQLVVDGRSALDLSAFDIARFSADVAPRGSVNGAGRVGSWDTSSSGVPGPAGQTPPSG